MLNALFFPVGTKEEPIPFDSLFIPAIYHEIYYDGLYIDVLNGHDDLVIMDVGANIGVTTQHFKDYAKKVYSIEPSSEHFEALQKNKEFNKWDHVEVFNAAIADKDGEMTLHKLSKNRTCNSIVNDYGDEGQKVKTFALDTFFKDNNIEHVDFMKLDVEGAEDLILRSEGFKNVYKKIDNIEIEFHYPSWPNLVAYLETLGFSARRYNCSAIVLIFTR